MSTQVLLRVEDAKGRPAIIVRNNGMVIFYRYVDMDETMKEHIAEFYNTMKEEGVLLQDEHGKNVKDIQNFINFRTEEAKKDRDICG